MHIGRSDTPHNAKILKQLPLSAQLAKLMLTANQSFVSIPCEFTFRSAKLVTNVSMLMLMKAVHMN